MAEDNKTPEQENPQAQAQQGEMPQLTGDEKIVVLFTAETQDGKPFYAYIHLTLKKFAEFAEKQQSQETIDLTALGDIVAKGWGHEPPEDVHQKIVDEYGEIETIN